MAVYLRDRPPARRQYRSPRRATPSGVCVVHTAESFPDEVGPDTGAENVASFIRSRSTPGSYHDLADSDSIVQLVDYDDEAFHDGTGSNPHSYGVSAATQAHRWNSLRDDWVDATVRNMARAAARYARWIKTEHGVTIPARRISRAQSERRVPGFISHAERDPARRTDPGATFPWDDFLGYYADEMNGDDDMAEMDHKRFTDLMIWASRDSQVQRNLADATVSRMLAKEVALPDGRRVSLLTVLVWGYHHAAGAKANAAQAVAEIAKVAGLDVTDMQRIVDEQTETLMAEASDRDAELTAAAVVDELADRLDA